MILQDVARKVTEEDVEKALQAIYFHDNGFDKNAYVELLEQLKQVEVRQTECNMTIHVEYTKDCGSEESIWTSTYSMNKRFNRKFLLVFATPEQIAGAHVMEEDLSNPEEYMAHVLREMLYQNETDEDESDYQAEEKRSQGFNEHEYCSVKDTLESMEEETYDD